MEKFWLWPFLNTQQCNRLLKTCSYKCGNVLFCTFYEDKGTRFKIFVFLEQVILYFPHALLDSEMFLFFSAVDKLSKTSDLEEF